MKISKKKTIKIINISILLFLVLLLVLWGIQKSDFSKLKKYDKQDKPSYRESVQSNKKISYENDSMQVTIVNEREINLGDFVFNISNDRKLIANISLQYQPLKEKNNWFGRGSAQEEFIQKGALLRDLTIDAVMGIATFNANDPRIRVLIKNKLNANLQKSRIEEIYFNTFIIQ